MDFFARQEAAQRTTRWLVVAFVLSIAAIIAVVDVLVVFALRTTHANYSPASAAILTAVLVAAIILGGTLFKTLLLRSGGAAVARSLGGTRVDRDVTDPAIRRLHNIVEEMAIASGVPSPEVYVLEDEDAINAFAAGNSPADAVIAVTRGALRRLNREELQGVIGHEFSHVLNGDMRLNVKLMGLTFGLLVVAIVGRTVLRFGPRGGNNRDRSGGAAALMIGALALMVLGYIGVFFGHLMQAAVSRHRERLADASSVQFTRNPGGLKNALLKIAASESGSQLETPQVEEAAHMLFAPGMSRAFATHPSIAERIAALDPSFKESQLPELTADARRQTERMLAAAAAPTGSVVDAPESAARTDGSRRFIENVGKIAIASHVGSLDPGHVRYASDLRAAIPAQFRDVAGSPDRARALVFALLASDDPAVLERQRGIIEATYGAEFFAEVMAYKPVANALDPQVRLPAVSQLFPTLRRLTPTERAQLADVVERLSAADARIDVFECCLSLLLAANLSESIATEPPHGSRTLDTSAAAAGTLITILASQGAASDEDARRAYDTGMAHALPGRPQAFQPVAGWQGSLRDAIGRLKQLEPAAKRTLIEAMSLTIAHDNRMTTEEAEILRTVCSMLHCPLPPLPALRAAVGGS